MKTYDKILSFQNEISKQLYEDSIQQRNQLNGKFSSTLTILSAEIGGIIWLILKVVKNISGTQESISVHQLCSFMFLTISLILIGVAVIYFILCFTKYDFAYPSPNKVKDYIKENKQYLGEYSEKEVLNNIIQNISTSYIDIAINNDIETTKHAMHLNKCYICMISALLFMAVDFLLVVLL